MSEITTKYLDPLEQVAVHKQTFEINGEEFTCQESYYEGELLNGVDLRIKELRGLDPNPNLIDYLRESQELVFCASSSMILYNTHKRNFHHLLHTQGEVVFLRTRLDRTNNREYILWVEKLANQKEQQQFLIKKYGSKAGAAFKESKLKKKNLLSKTAKGSMMSQEDSLLKTMFSGYGQQNDLLQTSHGQSAMKSRKVTFGSNWTYNFKVYDYTKKQLLFQSEIKLDRQTIADLFIFDSEIKVVGYIASDQELDLRYINFTEFKRTAVKKVQASFQFMQTKQKISNLLFNYQESCYLFYFQKTFYKLSVYEHLNAETNQISQFLGMSLRGQQPAKKPVKINIRQQAEFETEVLSMAMNDQYLAVLTQSRIYFHSAFDTQSLIFYHVIEDTSFLPKGIEFNKSNLIMTHQDSSMITTFQMKNKGLRMANSTTLQITNCKEIIKFFCNTISSEVFCVVNYQIGNRAVDSAKKQLQYKSHHTIKPVYMDVSASFLSPGSKTEARVLKVGKQKFKKLHSCPWLSSYLIETQDSVHLGDWKESFDGKRCVQIHPTGIFMVVCFKQSFKIYMLTFQSIVNTYRGDSINDIQHCAISHQGNHMTVASTNIVYIYDFYSCKKLKTLNLPLGVTIDSMYFRAQYLCCYLRNKKLFIYNSMDNYKEVMAFNPKAFIADVSKEEELQNMTANLTYQLFNYININSVFYDPFLQIIIFSAKGSVYFYNCLLNEIMINVDCDAITCFHYCENIKTLFMGTENGEVICFPWPNKPSNLMNDFRKYKIHKGSIITMLVSSDLKQLITLGQDNSLSICYLTFVKNLKRLEGLQLIEFLGNNARVNFDNLLRRGFYPYTHTEFNSKLDTLKDYEDEAMNMTFMMPEERLKQKQHMFSNINHQTFQLTEVNSKELAKFSELTHGAKEDVNALRQALQEFEKASKIERQQLKKDYFEDYLEKFNVSEKSKERLATLTKDYSELKDREREVCQRQEAQFKKKCQQDFKKLQAEFRTQKDNWWTEQPDELNAIEEEKKEFIKQNVETLSDIIDGYSMSNGALSCKNNNLQKDIMQVKKKIEEHKFLLYRLKVSTEALQKQQQKYQAVKGQKETLLQKEDKINLVEIEKRYVKQTKLLIEKDKEINVKINMHDKEQTMLIYLEKCLESLEQNIEQVVQNLMAEKKDSKELTAKIIESKTQFKRRTEQLYLKKKDLSSLRNGVNNFIYSLTSASEELISDRKSNAITLLHSNNLLSQSDIIVEQQEQKEVEQLQNIDEEQLFKQGKKRNVLNMTEGQWKGSYRRLKTEGNQTRKTQGGQFLLGSKNNQKAQTFRLRQSQRKGSSTTTRMLIDKNSKKVMFRQREQQKCYERIQTEQVVYQNSYRKINKENKDLIESYNILAMESKKIVDSLKRQKLINNLASKKEYSRHKDLSPTPFQNYLKKKQIKQKSNKLIRPAQIYQI